MESMHPATSQNFWKILSDIMVFWFRGVLCGLYYPRVGISQWVVGGFTLTTKTQALLNGRGSVKDVKE